MTLYRPNPSQVTLQVTTHNIDGTPKLSLLSANVRVYHIIGGAEINDLGSTPLTQVGSSNVWRYNWAPVSLPIDKYFAEYTLVDNDGAQFVDNEVINVMDVAEGAVLSDVSDGLSDVYDWTEISQYQGAIHYNNLDGTTGQVVGVNGLPHNPCREEADAQALAAATGLRKYRIHYGAFYMTTDHSRWIFDGTGADGHIKLDPAYQVNGSHFSGVSISGEPAGNNAVVVEKCILWPDLKGLHGAFYECVIAEVLYLGAGDNLILGGTSQPSPYCTIDCGGNTIRLHVANFAGEMHLRNFGPGSYADFDLASGKVTLESTCTGGIVEIRGETEFIDQTTDPNKPIIVNRAAVNQRDVIETDVDIIKRIEQNRKRIFNNQLIIYDDDGVTEWLKWDLFDVNGIPTNGIKIYDTVPV